MAIITEFQEEEEVAKTYDVYLSFRGIDTRNNFTDYLYHALVNENISTFLDEEELETGQELKPEFTRAIKSSRASIIVLSKNYASSTWCLDELVMILEQRRKFSNHFVLPVFYHVEPTHVRKQESSFGDALYEHKLKMEKEMDVEKKIQAARKLESWTKGLTEVADLKGKDANGRRERVVIEEIVMEISSRLDLHLQSKIPHLIGMETSINNIRTWLKGGSSKTAEILTIWGMAGIGKTSLAKYIYWLHHHEFKRSSFIEDIERRCAQESSTLHQLQNQLLGDILKKSTVEEHNVDACTFKIQRALLNTPTLVVLDGVDNIEQVDVLIGRKGLHPQSKIIITTKDGSLTEKASLFRLHVPPTHTKHALYGLSGAESLRLLCWHAFGSHGPKEGYEKEASRASKYCGGHPLALKVLGGSLINEDLATWRHTFEMLETGEFHTRVHKVLQISFDSLPSENCKELFKHIACFFVGKDRDVTETILKECGIDTSYGIVKLIERCLLTIGVGNVLKMHQLLQEMGRDLVRRESPNKPWKRSRVWNHEESRNILKDDKGTTKIQGLVLDMKMLEKKPLRGSSSMLEPDFQTNAMNMDFGVGPSFQGVLELSSNSHSKKIELGTNSLKKMQNLTLLQLNHVKLKGSYNNFPKGLRSLCMHGFQLNYIPSDLPMERLVALDMSCSNLKRLWDEPKVLGSLKYLNLSYCNLVTIGGFIGLPALERLILARCESLIHVCESIGGCNSLVLLDISYCNKLKNLPGRISKLKNIKVLSLNGCIGGSEVKKKMKIMKLLKLRKDSIFTKSHSTSSNEESVLRSSKSFLLCLPSSLVSLSLTDNNLCNESFPVDFSSMPMLKRLHLDRNPIDSMPDCVTRLIRLEVLTFAACKMLKSVEHPPSTIKRLSTRRCLSLVSITFKQEMLTPPLVDYEDSVSLTEVQGIIKIQPLANIKDDILCSLGWANLQYVKDQEVQIWDSYIWSHAKKLPVHMYYEFGIFSTCFPGKEVPNWLAHRNKGSSISFSIQPSSLNKKIAGINISFAHEFSGTGVVSSLRTKVWNMTKNRTWIYYGYIFAVREANEDMVWLSHWMFGNNELEAGDEISITIVDEEEDGGVMVTECAVSPLYNDRDKEETSLSYYKSWKHIIGRDLSAFQLTSGDYFLSHDRFFRPPRRFKELFEHKTTKNLLGYIPRYKDENVVTQEDENEYLNF